MTKELEVLDLESLAFSKRLDLEKKEMFFANFTERSLRAATWSFQGSPGTLIPDAHPMGVSRFWLPTRSCDIYVSNWQPGLFIVIIIITVNGTNTCERLL